MTNPFLYRVMYVLFFIKVKLKMEYLFEAQKDSNSKVDHIFMF